MDLKNIMIGIVMGAISAGSAQSSATSADAAAFKGSAASAASTDCQYPINDIRFLLCKL